MSSEVQLTILSPVHIGVSQEYFWQKNIDFFQDQEHIYVVKLDDVFKKFDLQARDIDKLVSDIGSGNLENFNHYLIKQRNLNLKDVAFQTFQFRGADIHEIRPMISSGQHEVMIPSSSLKGAIRTAFLRNQILKQPNFTAKRDHLGRDSSRKGFSFSDQQVQQNYIGKDPRTDPFRLLRFSDVYFQETSCHKMQIANRYRNGNWNWKKGQHTYIECITEGQIGKGTLAIPNHLSKYLATQGNVKYTELMNPQKLCEMINQGTRELLEYELDFWERQGYAPDFIQDYLDELERIAKHCEKGECVLRVGGGVGWSFITGAWARESTTLDDDTWFDLKEGLRKKDYEDDVPYPKTRKLTHQNKPLGFIKMKIG
ncbi:MAG: type III-A CRISPR-associated RAMP protein Csm5 [Flammeovirgaceae bacterium]